MAEHWRSGYSDTMCTLRHPEVLERGDRGEVNDRDYLAGDVGEAVAVGLQNFRRPMQLVGKRGGEEVFDSRAASTSLRAPNLLESQGAISMALALAGAR
jgi:hypothetical protein